MLKTTNANYQGGSVREIARAIVKERKAVDERYYLVFDEIRTRKIEIPADADTFIESFHGDTKAVFDYLDDKVRALASRQCGETLHTEIGDLVEIQDAAGQIVIENVSEAPKCEETPQRTVQLKPGQHPEDVYIILPRERDTIIAALRLWQDRDIRKVYNDWNKAEALQDIATNAGQHDALDENEIDILIEDKLQGFEGVQA